MTNDADTKKTYGLLGKNIGYSLSPAMHSAAFEHFDIPATYELFDIEESELESFLRERVLNGEINGFNVTVPYKIKIKELLEKGQSDYEFGQWVKNTGAVNTVKVQEGTIRAFNTDVPGFGASLDRDVGYNYRGEGEIFVMGVGGAGHAICIFLSMVTLKKINVYDINRARLYFLKDAFTNLANTFPEQKFAPDRLRPVDLYEDIATRLKRCDLVINATPLGTRAGDDIPIPVEWIREGAAVYDLVYARETELVKQARARGLKAENGIGMLVNQGFLSFKIWTGELFGDRCEKEDFAAETLRVMRDAVKKEMERRKGPNG